MTNLPPKLTPSELLDCEELPPFIDELLRSSRSLRIEGRLTEAESRALDARDASKKSGYQAGYAAALLHLADVYREESRFSLARTCYEEAQQIFHRQLPHVQRHNEAAATHGLGLAHQTLGNAIEALSYYQAALDLFENAREYWASCNDIAQVQTCQQAQRWIEDQIAHIMDERIGRPIPLKIFPIWELGGAEAPFAKNANQKYVTVERVLINGVAYWLHPISDQANDLPVVGTGKVNYFALPVPEDMWAVPEARVGDYVLVRQQWWIGEEKTGVVWEPGEGWIAVEFQRGRDGKTRFYHHPPKIIGGATPTPGNPSGKVKGSIIALLKPEK